MFEGIDGVLLRGELISVLGDKASVLVSQSSNNRNSKEINKNQTLVLGIVIFIISFILLFPFYIFFV